LRSNPFPAIAYLKKHLSLNGITNTDVFALAIADREGSASFRVEVTGCMGQLSDDGDIEVPTTTLDFLR
jgi:hypothetical protein